MLWVRVHHATSAPLRGRGFHSASGLLSWFRRNTDVSKPSSASDSPSASGESPSASHDAKEPISSTPASGTEDSKRVSQQLLATAYYESMLKHLEATRTNLEVSLKQRLRKREQGAPMTSASGSEQTSTVAEDMQTKSVALVKSEDGTGEKASSCDAPNWPSLEVLQRQLRTQLQEYDRWMAWAKKGKTQQEAEKQAELAKQGSSPNAVVVHSSSQSGIDDSPPGPPAAAGDAKPELEQYWKKQKEALEQLAAWSANWKAITKRSTSSTKEDKLHEVPSTSQESELSPVDSAKGEQADPSPSWLRALSSWRREMDVVESQLAPLDEKTKFTDSVVDGLLPSIPPAASESPAQSTSSWSRFVSASREYLGNFSSEWKRTLVAGVSLEQVGVLQDRLKVAVDEMASMDAKSLRRSMMLVEHYLVYRMDLTLDRIGLQRKKAHYNFQIPIPKRAVLLVPGLGGSHLKVRPKGAVATASASDDDQNRVAWISLTNPVESMITYAMADYNSTTECSVSRNSDWTVYAPTERFGLHGIEFIGYTDRFGPLVPSMNLLASRFRDLNYREGETLFGFPYDWRQFSDHPDTLQRLHTTLTNIREHTGMPVDIVSHSFGGLVTRSYLRKYANVADRNVASWTSLGTPFRGNLGKTLQCYLNGYAFDVPFLDPGFGRVIGLGAASLYETLPWAADPTWRRLNAGVEFQVGGSRLQYSYNELVDLMVEVNQPPGTAATADLALAATKAERENSGDRDRVQAKMLDKARLTTKGFSMDAYRAAQGRHASVRWWNGPKNIPTCILYGDKLPTPQGLVFPDPVERVTDLTTAENEFTHVVGGDMLVAAHSASDPGFKPTVLRSFERNHFELMFADDVFDTAKDFIRNV